MDENETPLGLDSVLFPIFHLGRKPQEALYRDCNRPGFSADMNWSKTSGRGLRATEKDVHTSGRQTKRSASSDVLPEMPPLWCGPPAS